MTEYPILFFDGVCNLCNKSVDYVIRQDHEGQFRFASLQSDYAKAELYKHNIDHTDLDTVVLLHKGQVYIKSKAAAQVLILIGGWRSILGYIIQIIPTPLANIGYDFIARRRYRLYGKQETCRLPTPAERERFLG